MPNVAGPILNANQAVVPTSAATSGVAELRNCSTSASLPVRACNVAKIPTLFIRFFPRNWLSRAPQFRRAGSLVRSQSIERDRLRTDANPISTVRVEIRYKVTATNATTTQLMRERVAPLGLICHETSRMLLHRTMTCPLCGRERSRDNIHRTYALSSYILCNLFDARASHILAD